jgi:hypothetical protein
MNPTVTVYCTPEGDQQVMLSSGNTIYGIWRENALRWATEALKQCVALGTLELVIRDPISEKYWNSIACVNFHCASELSTPEDFGKN